jgi:hypothetical protein
MNVINPYLFAAAGNTDPYFSSVKLLLHLDGTNGSTSATDYSPIARAITFYGNAQLTTTDPKFGTASLLLDGNGDYIDTPSSADFEFSGDFTIEAWVYLTTTSGSYKTIFGSGTYGLYHISNTLVWYSTAGGLTTFGTITNDAWHYVAISRSGTSLKCFVDGVQSGSTLTSSTSFTCTTTWKIGYDNIGAAYLTSKVDEVRVTKGVARDVSVIPTSAFPNS